MSTTAADPDESDEGKDGAHREYASRKAHGVLGDHRSSSPRIGEVITLSSSLELLEPKVRRGAVSRPVSTSVVPGPPHRDTSPVVQRPDSRSSSAGPEGAHHRTDRNPARSSSANSCGCSQAAKWPPLASWL